MKKQEKGGKMNQNPPLKVNLNKTVKGRPLKGKLDFQMHLSENECLENNHSFYTKA